MTIRKATSQGTLAFGLNFLLPLRCLVCFRPSASSKLCFACQAPRIIENKERCSCCYSAHLGDTLCSICEHFPSKINSQRHLWNYCGTVPALIRSMKYSPSIQLCQYLGKILALRLKDLWRYQTWDVLCPMPISDKNLKNRFFNQCEILAQEVYSKNKDVFKTFEPMALKHQGSKHSQAHIAHKRRLKNVRGVFSVEPQTILGKSVLILDDVTTTGATISAAAQVLTRAGAKRVDVLTLARASTWQIHRIACYQEFESLQKK